MERSADASFLGSELKRVRVAAGRSQEELAGLLGFDRSVVSKSEGGKPLSPELVRAYVARFPELDGEQLERWSAWIRKNGAGPFPRQFIDWADEEKTARSLLYWSPTLVGGMFQTEGYARVILATEASDAASQEERLQGRLDRQEILSRTLPPLITVIMSEFVLLRDVGGHEVMNGQLARLYDLGQHPRVVMQVIPQAIGAHAGLAGPVSLADQDDATACVYSDGFTGGTITKNPDAVSAARETIELLRGEALPRTASLELIRQIQEETWKL